MIPRCLRLRRTFHVSARQCAASKFLMPAMSPTMTEGNITSWKMKEGDSFSAGDVILEIETDKATMDVEAQDDGILAKILVGDGKKGVSVGTNIAVMAEAGDDLSAIDLPTEAEPAKKSTASSEEQSSQKKEETKQEVQQTKAPKTADKSASKSTEASGHGLTNKDGSVISPAVQSLLRHYSITDPHKIPATGPRGRLVKGDVLAFAKKIEPSSNQAVAEAYAKRGKLDLSNIKKAPTPAKKEMKEPEVEDVKNPVIELRRQVNLNELILMSEKLSEESGVRVTIETLAAKAAQKALQDVPKFGLSDISKEDQLFNEVLYGPASDSIYEPTPLSRQTSSGVTLNAAKYFNGGALKLPPQAPQSSLLTLQAASPVPAPADIAEYDILDFLSDVAPRPTTTPKTAVPNPDSCMLASLSFDEGAVNAKTASIYLDRVAQYVENPAHLFL